MDDVAGITDDRQLLCFAISFSVSPPIASHRPTNCS